MDTMEVDASMTDQQAEPHSLVQANSSKASDSVPIPPGKSLFAIDMSRMALTRPINVFCSFHDTAIHTPRESFREIAVKVHIRRPERDSWVYLGRAMVSQEIIGQSSRVGACHSGGFN